MRDDQADQIINLLAELLEEVRGQRTEFLEFTGYNTMTTKDLADAITGPSGYSLQDVMGTLPYSIQDVHDKLVEVASSLAMIEINTNT